jgi:hypothetical protein
MRLAELMDQGLKYRTALLKCLQKQGFENPHISIVFVVGEPLFEQSDPKGPETIREALLSFNGRVINYEDLIHKAQAAYKDFLDGSAKADRIDRLLKGLQ